MLVRLGVCTITLYAADHPPPHFHVRTRNGREALIVIADLTVLSGSVARRELVEAVSWAHHNAQLLRSRWQELNP